ncbi:uL13 family ribosomal protein [Agrobacterium sp. Azo12]|uniref:uL13 family ribosomal protein n=1 Tax=Agrobacterium sp. Azo12 TaxID=3031129 RepID=UPI0023D8B59E|nr:uL13 family ribosomal protein [Agrobacterium sp. Azo12]MDO5897888.1 uL13 family ribosomal protein [Agrobacterium sp. Azo12]
MALQETFLFINRNIEDVVKTFTALELHKIEDDEQIVYLPSTTDPEFGLLGDLVSEGERAWTHVLFHDPSNSVALAATLKLLNVKGNELKAATKYDGEPLIDVDEIKVALETSAPIAKSNDHAHSRTSVTDVVRLRPNGSQNSDRGKATSGQPKKPGKSSYESAQRWVIIDANGTALGQLARVVAATLGQTKARKGGTVGRVVVVNSSKVETSLAQQRVNRSHIFAQRSSRLVGKPLAKLPKQFQIRQAVRRALSGKQMERVLIKNLLIYSGSEFPATDNWKDLQEIELISDDPLLAKTIADKTGVRVETSSRGHILGGTVLRR